MNWFKKVFSATIRTSTEKKRGVPEGLWSKCDGCSAMLYRAELERSVEVCPKCDYHHRMSARKRLNQFFDPESGVEIGAVRREFNGDRCQRTVVVKADGNIGAVIVHFPAAGCERVDLSFDLKCGRISKDLRGECRRLDPHHAAGADGVRDRPGVSFIVRHGGVAVYLAGEPTRARAGVKGKEDGVIGRGRFVAIGVPADAA